MQNKLIQYHKQVEPSPWLSSQLCQLVGGAWGGWVIELEFVPDRNINMGISAFVKLQDSDLKIISKITQWSKNQLITGRKKLTQKYRCLDIRKKVSTGWSSK